MKYSVLAARRQIAMEQIVTETQRLGGSLLVPAARGDVEHQQLALLEAIAEALAAIDTTKGAKPKSGKAAEVEPVEAVISVVEEPAKDGEPAEVEPVEAVISVIAEPAEGMAEAKPAPKKRGKS